MKNFNENDFIKQTKSELTADKIINDIYSKWWDKQGYTSIYYLGVVSQLKSMIRNMKDGMYLSKKGLLMIVADIKDHDVPEEIKTLVDDILEEFDYKDDNNEEK